MKIKIIITIIFVLNGAGFAFDFDNVLNNYIRERDIIFINAIKITQTDNGYLIKIDTPDGIYVKCIGSKKEQQTIQKKQNELDEVNKEL